MNEKLIESVANRQLFCDLIELINALHDSKDLIEKIDEEGYEEFTRGYVAGIECCIHMLHSIIDSYIDAVECEVN